MKASEVRIWADEFIRYHEGHRRGECCTMVTLDGEHGWFIAWPAEDSLETQYILARAWSKNRKRFRSDRVIRVAVRTVSDIKTIPEGVVAGAERNS